ncbi:hypothetical protein EG329_011603 [Mollisiaceae sp. DMI_Dod_QoI]|nr:hypothetical protein EG329_011603 [Helotiales sp. DMI_Dod_QoI]
MANQQSQDLAALLGQAMNANIAPQFQDGQNPPLPPNPPAVPAPLLPAQLPPLPITQPENAWQWAFADINLFRQAQRARNKKDSGKAWMSTESKWKDRVGKSWKPVKVFGRGSQSVVGHWTYDGSDRAQRTMNDVAVKQAVKKGPTYTWGDGLEKEARLLMLFQQANTPHVVRMYRHLYEDAGQQTDDFDHGVIHRIFLEYCSGGDLNDWLGDFMNRTTPVPEYDLWCIFHCLARACLVIHHGSEDPTQPRWGVKEIAHLDPKLENVLVGGALNDVEHRNMPAFKISDFGLAQEVPAIQSRQYLDNLSGTGSMPWYLPEQIQSIYHPAISTYAPRERPWIGYLTNRVSNPRLGTASNIWHIGLIMWVLMRQPYERLPDWGTVGKLLCYISTMTPRLQAGGGTLGSKQDIEAEQNPKRSIYSKALRSLIMECLLVSPAKRIPPAELVKRTGDQLDAQRMRKGATALNTNLQRYAEPLLSQRWYSGNLNGNPANAPQNQPSAVPVVAGAPPPPVYKQAPAAAQPPPLVLAQPGAAVAPLQVVPPAVVLPAAPLPPAFGNAGVNQGANGPLHPVPSPLTFIVQRKARFFGMGGGHTVFNIQNLAATVQVGDVKTTLKRLGAGVEEKNMEMRHGRILMLDNMKLGEFQGLRNVRATEV